jgi:site-specific DNA recombinase
MRAYIYARCSTDKQDLSIEDQVKAAETYVAKTGGAVVDVLQDEAVSGAEMDRPGLKALLEACERGNGAATHVLVWDSSRLGRPKDRLDGMHIIRRIQNAGKKLVYVSTGQEVDDSLGSDILGVVQFEANADYIRRASLASFRGVKARVDLCFDPGRTVPYGKRWWSRSAIFRAGRKRFGPPRANSRGCCRQATPTRSRKASLRHW